MPTDLTELIERVEKATGPDRKLDAAITVAIMGTTATADDLIYYYILPTRDDQCSPGTYWRKQRSGASLRTSEKLTASLDAALALVEEKMANEWPQYEVHARMIRSEGKWFHFFEITVPSREFQGRSRHAPIALLQCLLRALQSQSDRTDAREGR